MALFNMLIFRSIIMQIQQKLSLKNYKLLFLQAAVSKVIASKLYPDEQLEKLWVLVQSNKKIQPNLINIILSVHVQAIEILLSQFIAWRQAYLNITVEPLLNIDQWLLQCQKNIPIDIQSLLDKNQNKCVQSCIKAYNVQVNKNRVKQNWSKQFVQSWREKRYQFYFHKKLISYIPQCYYLNIKNQFLSELQVIQEQASASQCSRLNISNNAESSNENYSSKYVTQTNIISQSVPVSELHKGQNKQINQEKYLQNCKQVQDQTSPQQQKLKNSPKKQQICIINKEKRVIRNSTKNKKNLNNQQIMNKLPRSKNTKAQKSMDRNKNNKYEYITKKINNKRKNKDKSNNRRYKHKQNLQQEEMKSQCDQNYQPQILIKQIIKRQKILANTYNSKLKYTQQYLNNIPIRVKNILIYMMRRKYKIKQNEDIIQIAMKINQEYQFFMKTILCEIVQIAKIRNQGHTHPTVGDQFKYFSNNRNIQCHTIVKPSKQKIYKLATPNKLQIHFRLKYQQRKALQKLHDSLEKYKSEFLQKNKFKKKKIKPQTIKVFQLISVSEIPYETLYTTKKEIQAERLVIRNCHVRYVMKKYQFLSNCIGYFKALI